MHYRNACAWILINTKNLYHCQSNNLSSTLAQLLLGLLDKSQTLHDHLWLKTSKGLYSKTSLILKVLKNSALCAVCWFALLYQDMTYIVTSFTKWQPPCYNKTQAKWWWWKQAVKGHQCPFKNVTSKDSLGVEGLACSTDFNGISFSLSLPH